MSNPSPACIQAADLWADVLAVRQQSPLVHSVTNLVVTNFNANMLLALGASPLMAHAHEEVQDMARLAQAVVLNIGTLDPYWVQSMGLALAAAVAAGRPTVLDPVGAGASAYRNQTLLRLLAGRPSVLRGNGSEILAVAGSAGASKGVDSTASSDAAVSAAQALARGHGMVVVVSGQHDHVLAPDGRHAVLSNGHPLMTRVTGVGCSASALVGAFAAVQPDPWRASVAAMAYLGVAGEWAAERVAQQQGGVGSYQIALLDAVDRLHEDRFMGCVRLAQPGHSSAT